MTARHHLSSTGRLEIPPFLICLFLTDRRPNQFLKLVLSFTRFHLPSMASNQHDDDTMPEETQGYKLSQPKQSLAEYQQMGT